MSDFIEWSALGNIVWVGIVVGAGVPFMFALGVWAIAGENARRENGRLPLGRRLLSFVAFGVAIAASLAGVAMLEVVRTELIRLM